MAYRLPLRTFFAAGSAVALSYRQTLSNDDGRRSLTPIGQLFRSYFVYSLCTIGPLVDKSPQILATLTSIPGIGSVTEAVVRRTFYAQARHTPTSNPLLLMSS